MQKEHQILRQNFLYFQFSACQINAFELQPSLVFQRQEQSALNPFKLRVFIAKRELLNKFLFHFCSVSARKSAFNSNGITGSKSKVSLQLQCSILHRNIIFSLWRNPYKSRNITVACDRVRKNHFRFFAANNHKSALSWQKECSFKFLATGCPVARQNNFRILRLVNAKHLSALNPNIIPCSAKRYFALQALRIEKDFQIFNKPCAIGSIRKSHFRNKPSSIHLPSHRLKISVHFQNFIRDNLEFKLIVINIRCAPKSFFANKLSLIALPAL
uniref:Uncharacterized protein n=1 Tax=uncultured bacterium contig00029 TaxID=1181518 RepID=A0A806KC07_9BACT|nr:hypothetical protein [uncultured bacterium contig00029]